jgi:hypothetical protein
LVGTARRGVKTGHRCKQRASCSLCVHACGGRSRRKKVAMQTRESPGWRHMGQARSCPATPRGRVGSGRAAGAAAPCVSDGSAAANRRCKLRGPGHVPQGMGAHARRRRQRLGDGSLSHEEAQDEDTVCYLGAAAAHAHLRRRVSGAFADLGCKVSGYTCMAMLLPLNERPPAAAGSSWCC